MKMINFFQFVFLIFLFTDTCSSTILQPQFVHQIISLPPFQSSRIIRGNLSAVTCYVLFQVHTHAHDVVLSYDDSSNSSDLPPDRVVIGKNIGLVVDLNPGQSEVGVYVKSVTDKLINLLVITSDHSLQDPVPGGCNMEFNVETSPFLKIDGNKLRNRIEWQPAAIGLGRRKVRRRRVQSGHLPHPLITTNLNLTSEFWPTRNGRYNTSSDLPHRRYNFKLNDSVYLHSQSDIESDPPDRSCDTSYNFITYQTYAYYLQENDYSEDEYFRGIKLMSDPKMVMKYAKSRDSMSPSKPSQPSRTKSLFLSYPGRGVIFSVLCFTIASSANVKPSSPISISPSVYGINPRFNVLSRISSLYTPPIVNYESVTSRSAAYVPIVTYNCDLGRGIESCGKLSGVWDVLFVSVLAISGFIISLRGHQWFNLQVVWTSFILASIVSFILITKYSTFTHLERDILVLISSTAFSTLWLFLWKLIGSPILTLLSSGLLLGFLISSSALFSTLGNDDIFRNDLNYWLIMGCGSIIIPISLVPFAVLMSVLSSSIVGSYAVVFTVDRFIGGSISFIIINVFKRAIYSHDVDTELYQALNNVPIQGKDVILLSAWFVLSLVGMCLQIYNSLDQPPFPSNNNSCCRPRVVDLNTATVESYPVQSSRRSVGRPSRRRRSRSRSIGSGRVRSRSTRRNAQATVTDPSVSTIVGVSGTSQIVIVRPSAPPTEAAEEIRPLLCDPVPIDGHASKNYDAIS